MLKEKVFTMDRLYSPVKRDDTIQSLLSLVVQHHLDIDEMDAVNVYLQVIWKKKVT